MSSALPPHVPRAPVRWLATVGLTSVSDEPAPAADAARARLRWLTNLRWVAIGGQLAVLVPAVRLGWLAPPLVVCFLSVVAALVVLNLLTIRWIRRDRAPGPDMVLVQLGLDVGALCSLLLLSGGAWNPLAPLLFVHAGLSALLLSGGRSAAMLVGLFAAIAAISVAPIHPPALPDLPTPVEVVMPSLVLVALVIWGFTAWMTRSLAEHRRLLLNLRDHQERGDRLRAAGALAAGFSHEFSTPLNTLKLRLARLGRGPLGEEDPDLVAARAAAERCESVLRKMVGRPLEPAELRMEAVELPALVTRICASWTAPGRRAEVVVLTVPSTAIVLPTLAFTQALLNLLDNAAEAGAAESAVRVEIDGHPRGVRVAVLDRGPGWPALVREHLGEPFVTTKPQGTGLGLYNAHALAVALGGRLRLLDRPGGGANAEFDLPLEAFARGALP